MARRGLVVVAVLCCSVEAAACAATVPKADSTHGLLADGSRTEELAFNTPNADVLGMVHGQRIASEKAHASDDRACAGLSAADREAGPFARAHVKRVAPLYDHLVRLKASWTELRGSIIELEAGPYVTKQWLARLAQCQIAHYSNHRSGEQASPFELRPLQVTVEDSPTGFVILLRAANSDKELARRVLETSRVLLLRQAS